MDRPASIDEREAKTYEAETPCRVRISELLRQHAQRKHEHAVKLTKLAEWLDHRMPMELEGILWDVIHGLGPI